MPQEFSASDSLQVPSSTRNRLPEIKANTNKRAERILKGHLHNLSSSTFVSSAVSIPVLQQIDSTASRTARTHDISHLRDTTSCLAPRVPPSLLPKEDYVFERSFLPKGAGSTYSAEDGLWHTQVFPSRGAPSGRTDAIMLDQWINKSLDRYADRMTDREDLAQAVEELVPILSLALHEIVRQVTHYCVERGAVLEKIWRTYTELFDRVLKEMHASLRTHKEKTAEVQDVLRSAQSELESLRKNHPHQMQRVIADLEGRFTAKQRELEDELRDRERNNGALTQELRDHHIAIESWYPMFHIYQNSYVKASIPSYGASNAGSSRTSLTLRNQAADELTPEVALAEDFKRLLAALPPEKRKVIGKELATLLMAPASPTQPKSKAKRESNEEGNRILAQLRQEVQTQEDRIHELVGQIEALDASAAGVVLAGVSDGGEGAGSEVPNFQLTVSSEEKRDMVADDGGGGEAAANVQVASEAPPSSD